VIETRTQVRTFGLGLERNHTGRFSLLRKLKEYSYIGAPVPS
jgi:hypothetical protein